MTTYKLAKEYIYLGIIGSVFVLISLYWESNIFSLILLIFIFTNWIRIPYRIDCKHDDSIVIHRILSKKQIKFKDIIKVTKGNFRDKIQIKEGDIYLTHLITNIDQLTKEIARTINSHGSEKNDVKIPTKEEKNDFDGPIRFLLILVISFVGSILFIIYLIKYLKLF